MIISLRNAIDMDPEYFRRAHNLNLAESEMKIGNCRTKGFYYFKDSSVELCVDSESGQANLVVECPHKKDRSTERIREVYSIFEEEGLL